MGRREVAMEEEADTDGKVRVRREEAKRVTCPACGAAPGELCEGGRGARLSVHLERLALASRVKKVLKRRGKSLR